MVDANNEKNIYNISLQATKMTIKKISWILQEFGI